MLLRGAAGVGKSALAGTLRGPINKSGGYFAEGKFDAYHRGRPYAGFRDALTGWCDQLLIESQERFAHFGDELRTELGSIARVLVDWVPDLALALVLGEVPAVPDLGPQETHARLVLALLRFVTACAQPGHPLVLFLDDLQWADAASLEMIEQLASASESRALLLVGAYRDDELDESDSFASTLTRLRRSDLRPREIELGPLSIEASTRMLADALQVEDRDVASLARQITRKTGNSALLIRQFTDHLCAFGWIRYELGQGWVWDDAQVAAAEIPEGAVGLIISHLARVEHGTLEIQKFASCLRGDFDLDLLRELRGGVPGRLEPALYALADAGLIIPCSNGYRFAHDRIREAAQSLLTEQKRRAVHYDLAVARGGARADLDHIASLRRAPIAASIAAAHALGGIPHGSPASRVHAHLAIPPDRELG